jgi:hypothetical protein
MLRLISRADRVKSGTATRRRYAAPLARPPPGSALGTPARHGRAAAVSLRRSITLTRHA